METSRSQTEILQRLKTRGPQSVKILAQQLGITTMGVRQHLSGLEELGLVKQTQEARQNRGRPVHFWALSGRGHSQFPDNHQQLSIDLLDVIDETLGREQLSMLVDRSCQSLKANYSEALNAADPDLGSQLAALAEARTAEGFMAEIRLLPDGWLFIENHCPLYSAAKRCGQYCDSELSLFSELLAPAASIVRTDHVLAGSRRCAYKVSATQEA